MKVWAKLLLVPKLFFWFNSKTIMAIRLILTIIEKLFTWHNFRKSARIKFTRLTYIDQNPKGLQSNSEFLLNLSYLDIDTVKTPEEDFTLVWNLDKGTNVIQVNVTLSKKWKIGKDTVAAKFDAIFEIPIFFLFGVSCSFNFRTKSHQNLNSTFRNISFVQNQESKLKKNILIIIMVLLCILCYKNSAIWQEKLLTKTKTLGTTEYTTWKVSVFRVFLVCILRIRSISPYSVRMRENTGQKNSEDANFSHSMCTLIFIRNMFFTHF